MQNTEQSILITGANSGLGFEAAAQLAAVGYGRIVLATRTRAKGDDARRRLVERVGRDPYEVLVVDVSDDAVVRAAVATLAERGGRLGALLLNAGLMSGDDVRRSGAGVELTVAASVTGHHVLATGLLEAGLLADGARIVVAGSEAARGDMPMMGLLDLGDFAAAHAGGDLAEAVRVIAKAQPPYAYKPMTHYAMTKAMLAWWGAALARRLPEGAALFVVSPGSAPATSVSRHQGWVMRKVMAPIMGSWLGQKMGMGMTVATAAGRYVDALGFDAERSGRFYASAPGKVVGPLVHQTQPHLLDRDSQEATWAAVASLTGADLRSLRLASGG